MRAGRIDVMSERESIDASVFGAAKQGIYSWLGWLGAIGGGMSLISVVVRLTNVGLRPMLQDLVGFYRGFLGPMVELVSELLRIEISQHVADLVILYLVFFGMSLRRHLTNVKYMPSNAIWWWQVPLLLQVLLLMPLWELLKAKENWERFSDIQTEAKKEETLRRIASARAELIQILIVPGVLVVFFLLNYAPV